ncbi:hypothetical protein Ocin01_16498 [Orchesella cincta]|uniref:Uncharacterized protein n=1 Tax=Orchesella cincta TaxID=48709 RepID=A0A1D2MB07_ORCCI|nr:hypothetical protein Ocin01_16498 [Orchesella cincta]
MEEDTVLRNRGKSDKDLAQDVTASIFSEIMKQRESLNPKFKREDLQDAKVFKEFLTKKLFFQFDGVLITLRRYHRLIIFLVLFFLTITFTLGYEWIVPIVLWTTFFYFLGKYLYLFYFKEGRTEKLTNFTLD